jgi:phosphoglucomutase
MSKIKVVETKPYLDQKMGTSGLRKKVKIYQQPNYIENFVQSVFNSYQPSDYKGKSLIIGGDGRFYNDVAIQLCIKIGVANGIGKIILAENGLMSTPAVSLLIRSQPKNECYGAFILTASHNPGGPNDDMGIKFNGDNGAAIPEGKNLQIFEESKKIEKYYILDTEEKYPLDKPSEISVEEDGKIRKIPIEIESTTKRYVEEMQKLFDFDLIKTLFQRKDFEFVFDALNGISGPYALAIFNEIFKVPLENLDKCHPLPDFGGIHPDPNLVHAKDLDEKMDVFKKDLNKKVPDFGAACDGDADRNIIFGPRMLVSPSDSLAVITNNAEIIKSLSRNGPLKGVARSMPTSGAVDRVAKKKNLKCYEVPTGWKFFGNLLDDGRISLCGEESFGTGSDHIREKDGVWAILCWLSILAQKNKDNKGKLIGIPEIMEEHWKSYGRDYYCRYDYEDLNNEQAAKVKENLNKNLETFKNMKEGNEALVFEYNDPVDHSVSKNQGWIYRYKDGSRIIFRFSGTSSTGATVRIYFEKHVEPDGNLLADVADIIKGGENFPELAVKLSDIHNVANRTGPTVMT